MSFATDEKRRLTDADFKSLNLAWRSGSREIVYATDGGRGLGLTSLAESQLVADLVFPSICESCAT